MGFKMPHFFKTGKDVPASNRLLKIKTDFFPLFLFVNGLHI